MSHLAVTTVPASYSGDVAQQCAGHRRAYVAKTAHGEVPKHGHANRMGSRAQLHACTDVTGGAAHIEVRLAQLRR